MDSSDQKTHRIDAGGDSAESSKSVGKSESGAAKSVKQKDAEWGYEPRKAGMALEAKLGMAVIAVLVGVFGFLVYRNFDLKQQQIAAIKGTGSEDETDNAKKDRPKQKEVAARDSDSGAGRSSHDEAVPQEHLLTAESDGFPELHEPDFSEEDRDESGFEETSLTLDETSDTDSGDGADALLNELLADTADDSEPEFDSGFDMGEPELAVADTQPEEPELFPEFAAAEEFPEFPAFDDGEQVLASETAASDDEGTLLAPATTIDLTPVTQSSEADSDPDLLQEPAVEEVLTGPSDAELVAGSDDVFEKALAANRAEADVETEVDEFAELVEPVHEQAPPDRLLALAEPQDDELLQTFGEERSSVTPKSGRPSIDPAFDQVVYDANPAPVRVSNRQPKIQQTSDAVSELCDICEARQDDNYWKISKRTYGTARYFSALALFNKERIPDPRKIRPGMKILIPEAKLLEKKYPELFRGYVRAPKKPSGFFLMADGTPAYRVGERETLSEISQKHLGRASRWIQIWRLNQTVLRDPNKVKPGTVIALPDDATNVGVAN